ncbi:hypothetical protein AX16_009891 [Volvariella volvacea WC 439]|nr:hypothetical protein AX16_009891 [Volvariella volvacea WC 439]
MPPVVNSNGDWLLLALAGIIVVLGTAIYILIPPFPQFRARWVAVTHAVQLNANTRYLPAARANANDDLETPH